MNERQFPASQAQKLEDPERLVWLPPAEVLSALEIRAGETVADVGAGTGYFALPLAHAVGAGGKVFAVDAQEKMLEWIEAKVEKAGLTNVALVQADAAAATLPDASCDVFLTANVWHELDDRAAVLAEARRVLKATGRIALLDWSPEVERVAGPPLEHRIAAKEVVAEVGEAGFRQAAARVVGMYSWLVMASM